jgi:ABC-2 type transport system permease protein
MTFARFELVRVLRNRAILMTSVLVPGLVYALSGNLRQARVGGLAWDEYFLGSMAAYAAMTTALVVGPSIATERANGWLYQLRCTPLPASRYIVVKFLIGVIVAIGPAVIIALEGVIIADISPWRLAYLLIAVPFGSVPFAALGMIVGLWARQDALSAILGVLVIVLAVFGGLFFPSSGLPWVMSDIGKALPTYQAAELYRTLLVRGTVPVTPVVAIAGYAVGLFALLWWRYQSNEMTSLHAF